MIPSRASVSGAGAGPVAGPVAVAVSVAGENLFVLEPSHC